MRFRFLLMMILCVAVLVSALPPAPVRAQGAQSGATALQRLDVLVSRLETLRRTLNSAIAGLNAKPTGEKEAADSPRVRLSGLEKEAGRLLSEVNDLHGKQERSERYDTTQIEKLETALADLDTRAQVALRETAGDRRAVASSPATAAESKKKKGNFITRIIHPGSDDKYAELVGTVAPGRDRQLFEEATKEARKDNYESARSLFNVIITTYPDSEFLPMSKLAIADTFYLEGTTSALIQAAQAYQDWLTFFPTHPLADDVMLKMAEVEMRRMGLPDRDITSAKKAEQRLKALLQQFPNTSLRPEVEVRLREVQEVLAMHNKVVGDLYYNRYFQGKASNPKGAQMRYREIAEKWPNFCEMDTILYRLGTTYVQEEEPDEASKYFQRLVRDYSTSQYADKAREQLAAIGSPVPDANPQSKWQPCESQSFFSSLIQDFSGATPKTIDKNGVIIANSDKVDDLIQHVVENNGTLPDSYTTRPVQRTAPARNLAPTAPPAKTTNVKSAVTTQPAQPGPPASGTNPTQPAAAPATTPAAAGNGVKP